MHGGRNRGKGRGGCGEGERVSPRLTGLPVSGQKVTEAQGAEGPEDPAPPHLRCPPQAAFLVISGSHPPSPNQSHAQPHPPPPG